MSREEIALADALQKYVDERAPMHSEVMLRRCISALHRVAPAQGEPVAWLYETWCGENSWSQRYTDAEPSKNSWTRNIRPLYLAALPSSPVPNRNCPKCGDAFPCKCVSYGSPVPDASPLNSGECEPVVKSASGAGEAIFSECAEIALEHVGMWPDGTYDEACQEIAEAITTRASNRKTMDAIADAALLKP
jgi:hypothetical protein